MPKTITKNSNGSIILQKYLMYACIILVSLIVLSIILRFYYIKMHPPKSNYNLKTDGVCVIKNLLLPSEINKIKSWVQSNRSILAKEKIVSSKRIQNKIQKILGSSYKFHDYIFSIKRSQIHTCHRDYNGDFFNKTQKYPSYTIIIYLENMEKCLEVIPKSHESIYYNAINFTDPSQTVLCSAGDAILFNANVIHSGAVNQKEDNMRIQMKISHNEDQKTLHFYQNYNKELDKKNTTSKWSKHLMKHFSCQFPILSTFSQKYDYDVTKKYQNTNQDNSSIFSKLFYGDSGFYNLKTLTSN